MQNFARNYAMRDRYHTRALQAMAPLFAALSYRPRVMVVPDAQGASVSASARYEGRVSVPVGSALWAISASSSQGAGFKINITDGASSADSLATEATFFSNLSGQGPKQVKDAQGNLHTIANPLCVLPQYRLVTEPGLLRVQLQNLAASVNVIQVALHFADAPRPGDPRNQWNAYLDAELNLARHAVRNLDLTTGQAITTTTTNEDPMSQPATNMPFYLTATGDQIVIPAAAGYRIAIHQLSLLSGAAQNIHFYQGTPSGTDLQGPLEDFGSGYFLPYQKEEPHFILDSGKPFVLSNSAGSGGTGHMSGFVKFRMLTKWGA